MNIIHRPLFNIGKVEDYYTKKDGVPVKYVCTSAIREHDDYAADIYYRDTPHPEFGNRYFGLHTMLDQMMITNADNVENVIFDMVDIDDELHYSQHRHDFYYPIYDMFIDGGRSYLRRGGDLSKPIRRLRVRDGNFEEVID